MEGMPQIQTCFFPTFPSQKCMLWNRQIGGRRDVKRKKTRWTFVQKVRSLLNATWAELKWDFLVKLTIQREVFHAQKGTGLIFTHSAYIFAF